MSVDRAGIHRGHLDLGTGNQRALFICDTTCYRSNGDCLRIECGRISEHHEDQQKTAGGNWTSVLSVRHNHSSTCVLPSWPGWAESD
jgi:hypothetical protein